MFSRTLPPDATGLLVAHHHALARRFISDNLAADGYRVLAAEDLTTTLDALHASDVAAIILDLGADTAAVLEHITSLDSEARPQVIALSNHHDSLHRGRLLRRGADEVIPVPFSYSELRYRLDGRLARRLIAAQLC